MANYQMKTDKQCVALACGDAFVSFSLTLVILIVGFIVLYPLFFVWIWRPYRIREAHSLRKRAHKEMAEAHGLTYREEDVHMDLSHAWHSMLHLDHRSGKHRTLIKQQDKVYQDFLPDREGVVEEEFNEIFVETS